MRCHAWINGDAQDGVSLYEIYAGGEFKNRELMVSVIVSGKFFLKKEKQLSSQSKINLCPNHHHPQV